MSLIDLNGYFITIEGGEGAGKTVQIKLLKEHLESLGNEVVSTREPGGVDLAEKIRYLLLNPDVTDMDGMTEILLYAAARREHFIKVIRPALKIGKIVICDRFFDSSFVYQGLVKGFGLKNVFDVNMMAVDNTMPNLTILLDLDPSIGLERIHQNDREQNRFDKASIDFHESVRSAYQHLAELFQERIVKVDASGTVDEVANEIKKFMKYRVISNVRKNKTL